MIRRKASAKRLGKRIDGLLPDAELSPADTPLSRASHIPSQNPQNLLTLRGSILRVVGELDQLLTMETLIYFLQRFIELLVLSFQFAYQQPSVAAHHLSIPTRLRQSFRGKTGSARRRTQKPPVSAESRPDPPLKSLLPAAKLLVDRGAQTSGTGSSPFAPRKAPRHAPTFINSALPPPPSLPKVRPSVHLAPKALQPLPPPAQAIVDSTTPPIPASTQTPPSRSPSKSPPRRKPVASGHVRKGSAKFDRPVPQPLEQPLLPDSTPSQAIPESAADQTQGPLPAVDLVRQGKSTADPATVPPLVKKTSAKFLRPPLTSSEAVKSTVPSEPSSTVSSQSPQPTKSKGVKTSNPGSPVKQKTLARKSSAKFIRPPISAQPSASKVDSELKDEPRTQSISSVSVSVEEKEPYALTQASQSVDDSPALFDQPADILQVQQCKPAQTDKPAIDHPRQDESSVSSTKQILQKPIPRPNLSLFPPRPAIAVVHSQPEPVDSSVAEIISAFSSFPELPPLLPSLPRNPPPPPSIPRFPSPTKAPEVPTLTPVETLSMSSPTDRPSSRSSVTETPVAPLPAPSDDPPTLTEASSNTEPPQGLPVSVFPREWDPSQEASIFESEAQSVSKPVIATAQGRRFSFHGSIESQSPTSDAAPAPESTEHLSSSHLTDRGRHARAVSTNSQYTPSPLPSPRVRPHSAGSVSSGSEYVPPAFLFDNTHLKPGNAAALLSHAETLNLYRQNAKKAVDNPAIQYEFAIFMMDAARESALDLNSLSPTQRDELTKEALSILRRLADRGYPQAQYYLADCYTNGIGCKHNNPDLEKAFPLFVLAAKHGHVEASFRAALAYENAWGCRRDPLKALQFYRKASSGNHPGAMLRLGKACLNAEFGMPSTQLVTVEGVNWLKRAVEAATPLYPNAPYELALLHEYGYKDVVFPDEAYAIQLFAKAADLGHAEAAYRLGEAYEYGRMGCPEDPALSVHYYSLAARGGNPAAMLSLCAWYLMGADGVFEKSEEEAFAWAHRAAELGLAKAEFATGYFLERGVGCRRDGLEAWKYYVRAADHGDERAVSRLRAGKEVNADRGTLASAVAAESSRWSESDGDGVGSKRWPQRAGLDLDEDPKPTKEKDCIVM